MSTPAPRSRGRLIRQKLPDPPPVYDQAYIAQLADAVNDYMVQATAPADVVAARFIMTAPVRIPEDVANTAMLPTGMLYLVDAPGAPGKYYVAVVLTTDS